MNGTIFEIEYRYLCAVLLDNDLIELYRSTALGPEIFSSRLGRACIVKIEQLLEAGDIANATSLSRGLMADGFDDFLEVANMTTAVETTISAPTDFKYIVEEWQMRNYKEQVAKLNRLMDRGNWGDIKAQAMATAALISDEHLVEESRSQKQVALETLMDVERIMDGKQVIHATKIYSGIPSMDRFFKPLSTATGDFVTYLCGATSTGKSSLMACITRHNIYQGKTAAVFLGETNHEGFIKQLAGQQTMVSIEEDDFRAEPMDRQARFHDALTEIVEMHEKNLWVYDDRFYIEDIVSRAKKLKKEIGKIDFLVIDHLHKLKCRKSFKDERLRMNYMSGELKPLGMELECPIICLAQPSRGFKSEGRPPMLSDLKESGNLEDDADRVWFLYLPNQDSDGNEQDRESTEPQIWLHQLKFRRGRTGTVRTRFKKQYTVFQDDHAQKMENLTEKVNASDFGL